MKRASVVDLTRNGKIAKLADIPNFGKVIVVAQEYNRAVTGLFNQAFQEPILDLAHLKECIRSKKFIVAFRNGKWEYVESSSCAERTDPRFPNVDFEFVQVPNASSFDVSMHENMLVLHVFDSKVPHLLSSNYVQFLGPKCNVKEFDLSAENVESELCDLLYRRFSNVVPQPRFETLNLVEVFDSVFPEFLNVDETKPKIDQSKDMFTILVRHIMHMPKTYSNAKYLRLLSCQHFNAAGTRMNTLKQLRTYCEGFARLVPKEDFDEYLQWEQSREQSRAQALQRVGAKRKLLFIQTLRVFTPSGDVLQSKFNAAKFREYGNRDISDSEKVHVKVLAEFDSEAWKLFCTFLAEHDNVDVCIMGASYPFYHKAEDYTWLPFFDRLVAYYYPVSYGLWLMEKFAPTHEVLFVSNNGVREDATNFGHGPDVAFFSQETVDTICKLWFPLPEKTASPECRQTTLPECHETACQQSELPGQDPALPAGQDTALPECQDTAVPADQQTAPQQPTLPQCDEAALPKSTFPERPPQTIATKAIFHLPDMKLDAALFRAWPIRIVELSEGLLCDGKTIYSWRKEHPEIDDSVLLFLPNAVIKCAWKQYVVSDAELSTTDRDAILRALHL